MCWENYIIDWGWEKWDRKKKSYKYDWEPIILWNVKSKLNLLNVHDDDDEEGNQNKINKTKLVVCPFCRASQKKEKHIIKY